MKVIVRNLQMRNNQKIPNLEVTLTAKENVSKSSRIRRKEIGKTTRIILLRKDDFAINKESTQRIQTVTLDLQAAMTI